MNTSNLACIVLGVTPRKVLYNGLEFNKKLSYSAHTSYYLFGGGSHIIVPNIYSIIDLNKITVLFNTYSYLLNCGGVTFFTFYLLYWGSDIVPSIVLQI